jgi:L,D-transpeptidase YbiS
MQRMNKPSITISIAQQTLSLEQDGKVQASWPVSTALKGAGNQQGSFQTPLGLHRIRAKIGAGEPLNTVFRGRRPTGEIYDTRLGEEFPGRDWILTRILWLCGEERGVNRGGNVDSQRRYIYIHGTPDSEPMGIPRSHGCIRMRNRDVAELFDRVPAGTPVLITSA